MAFLLDRMSQRTHRFVCSAAGNQAGGGEEAICRAVATDRRDRAGRVSVHHLEIKLAEEQKRSAVLLERLAEIEPAAARAEKLADIIEEIVKLGPKSRR